MVRKPDERTATKDVHIRLDDEAFEILKRRAERERRSLSWLARDIVEKALRASARCEVA